MEDRVEYSIKPVTPTPMDEAFMREARRLREDLTDQLYPALRLQRLLEEAPPTWWERLRERLASAWWWFRYRRGWVKDESQDDEEV